MALVKCKECGKSISDTARTCPHCGIKTEVETCPECGKKVKQNDDFCSNWISNKKRK
mgnify:CR=1 FL=1